MWRPKGELRFIGIGNGYYIICFNDMNDHNHALQSGPWMIVEHYLVVQRWRPDFDLFDEEFRRLQVWVRIPGPHLEYYNRRFLWRLGNIIGRPLK